MSKLRYAPFLLLIVSLAACGRGDAGTIAPRPTSVSSVPTTAPTDPPAAEATDAPAAESTAQISTNASAGDPIAAALAAGDPTAGQGVFQTQHSLPDGSAWACMSCHSVGADQTVLIGPPLYNIVERAATRVEGQNAVDYIHNSIINPEALIAPVPEGSPVQQWALQMPHGFGDVLSEQDLNNVIAYLLTLHD
jgi:mono/diheme cytochrome c family protein